MINRDKFYRTVQRGPFPGSIAISQREGMEVILDEWERRGLTEVSWLAYMLATAYHETAHTMQPVIETRQQREATNPSVETAISRLDRAWESGRLPQVKSPYWRKDKDGFSWLGRGFVQLTFKTNYLNAQAKTGLPIAQKPELMLQAGPAATVMFAGMIGGWFTGKKLSDFPRRADGSYDFVNMRRIINGLDRAEDIAGYARQFHRALLASVDNTQVAPQPQPQPPDVEQPEPQSPQAQVPDAQKAGIGAAILGWGVAAWTWVLDHPWEIAGGTIALALAIYAVVKYHHRKKD